MEHYLNIDLVARLVRVVPCLSIEPNTGVARPSTCLAKDVSSDEEQKDPKGTSPWGLVSCRQRQCQETQLWLPE
jgi:hypothetical protein